MININEGYSRVRLSENSFYVVKNNSEEEDDFDNWLKENDSLQPPFMHRYLEILSRDKSL